MTRSGAAAGHTGYFHEAAFYGSDDELLAIAVPFVEGGIEAGEPTLVNLGDRNTALVRAALGDGAGVTYVAASDQYARPAATIASYRDLLASYVAGGATQVRVIGEVPHPGTGGDWSSWLRYEGAINHAFDDFPLWGLCPYDTRITPADVLADVERLHPYIAAADGRHHRNGRFTEPAAYVRGRCRPSSHPLQAGAPALVLADAVGAAGVRRAVRAVAAETLLGPHRIDDLVLAASEVVTNAIRHGRPPVGVEVWLDDRTVVCQVVDGGDGPASPFAGLLPASPGGEGGYGLWLANQLCDRVDLDRGDDGFAVRLVVEDPAGS